MTQTEDRPKDDRPDIDTLLQNSNWEARVAEARAKRDKVLAARRAADDTAAPAAPARKRGPYSLSAPPQKKRRGWTKVSLALALLLLAAGLGAGTVWMLLR